MHCLEDAGVLLPLERRAQRGQKENTQTTEIALKRCWSFILLCTGKVNKFNETRFQLFHQAEVLGKNLLHKGKALAGQCCEPAKLYRG